MNRYGIASLVEVANLLATRGSAYLYCLSKNVRESWSLSLAEIFGDHAS